MTPPLPPTSTPAPNTAGMLKREEEERWVPLTTFGETAHADVVRGLMEQAQIPVRLTDAHTASMLGLPTLALGGVGLQVPERDAERASALLKDTEQRPVGIAFRVRHARTLSLPLAWMAAAGLVAWLGARWGVWTHQVLPGVLALAAATGFLLGRRSLYFLCSTLTCGARLPATALSCARCGAQVVGEIRSLNERLEAAEAYRASTRPQLNVP